jgi:PEP-CTERM motif
VVRAGWIAVDKARIAGIVTGEKMKQATGLVLAVLAFAVVAHADRIEYGGRDYAAGAGAELTAQATFTEALRNSKLLLDSGSIALRAGAISSESGDAARLSDFVYYSHFGDSEEAAERPIESDPTRLRLENIWADRVEGLGEFLRIERRDPFRRELGVQDVSEPGTLLLMGAGLAALALLWKRHASRSEQPFVRIF